MESILTKEEIVDLLRRGVVGEIEVLKDLGDGKYRCRYRLLHLPPTPKVLIDVWNCHGVLKRHEWGVGYGRVPEAEGVEWQNIGWFTVPLRKGKKLTEEEAEEVEKVLWGVLEVNGGAINMSGFYNVPPYLLERLEKFKDKLAIFPPEEGR